MSPKAFHKVVQQTNIIEVVCIFSVGSSGLDLELTKFVQVLEEQAALGLGVVTDGRSGDTVSVL